MAPLSVDQALRAILDDAGPLASEHVGIHEAGGRILAAPVVARLTQPPFDASAMDGYAVRARDVAALPAALRLTGEAAAGRGFRGSVGAGEAVRIFTGAPVPQGADAIVIQENVRRDGDRVVVTDGTPDPGHIRPRGGDFAEGRVLLEAGRRLDARALTLAAAAGHAALVVHRRPVVAILATGDELVPPGTMPGRDQIISSNPVGLAAMVRAAGGEPRLLGIAHDTAADLAAKIALAEGADVLVTIGGASVGDHDLVAPALREAGVILGFWKIAMRPGKPMMFGTRGALRVLGLPGNPVSSLICARVFLLPLLTRLAGRADAALRDQSARLAVAIESNGPRQHYMRATLETADPAAALVRPAPSQDSSLLAPLAEADCLIVRPPGAPALAAGEIVPILTLDF
ncbi:MAG: gephyrin-like molybdotransferase Glp [Hyphomicrobium sp.]